MESNLEVKTDDISPDEDEAEKGLVDDLKIRNEVLFAYKKKVFWKVRDYAEKGKLTKAFRKLKKHEAEIEKNLSLDDKNCYNSYWYFAFIYYVCFDYESAYKWLLKAKNIYDKFGPATIGLSTRDEATLFGMIGDVLCYIGPSDEGVKYIEKYVEIIEQNIVGPHVTMSSLRNLSGLFVSCGKFKDKISFYQAVLEVRESTEKLYIDNLQPPKDVLVVNCCNDIVEAYIEEGDIKKASELLAKAVRLIDADEFRKLLVYG